MPGLLVHVGAQVQCSHAGQAQPAVPNPRVSVGGQPTVLYDLAVSWSPAAPFRRRRRPTARA